MNVQVELVAQFQNCCLKFVIISNNVNASDKCYFE